MASPPLLKPLIISAPFGNYVQPDGATATLGTFTVNARAGRLWRILKTVRFYRRLRAWVNKIGLRNPGMPWLKAQVASGKIKVGDKIVSIHGFNDEEWSQLLEAITHIKPLAVEMNMSCPNVGEVNWPDDLFTRAMATGVPVIVKLPPVNFEQMFDQARAAGVETFHCCNTLPVPAGGVSGKPLKPVAMQCIREVTKRAGSEPLIIIGGGGIYDVQDVDDYINLGVRHIAVGTKVMNPKYLFSQAGLAPILTRATERLGKS